MRLSIVIPAHNEERRIGPMLETYLPFFAFRYSGEVEVLVVVNGSTDRTEAVIEGYRGRFPCLRMVVEPAPIGKGGALMLGFREAKGELVGFADADGSTPPEAFQDLVDKIGDAGAIIASRWARGAQVSPRQPLDRRLASRIFNFLVRVMFGLRLTDTQCGAKLIRREAVQAILPHLGVTRWAFDVDLLFQLRRAGFRIVEIPTVWHDVAGSKIQVGKASAEMAMAMVRLRLIYSPFKWVVAGYNRYLGPWIHPDGVVRDYLFTHTLMLMIGAQFANICNLFFQVVMLRMLGKAEYGVLSVVLGAVMVLAMPVTAISGAITHYASGFMNRREAGRVKAMLLAVSRDMLLPLALLTGAVLWFQKDLMGVFQLESPWPVMAGLGIVVMMVLAAIPAGALGGGQAFAWVATAGNSWTVVRLVLGVVAVGCGLGAVGALSAHLVGMLVTAVLTGVICLKVFGGGWERPERPAGFYPYLGGYAAATLAYGVLAGADVILVKWLFSPEEAGTFAQVATVARIVVFLPGPVAQAMFPKVTEGEGSRGAGHTLVKAIAVTGLLVLAAVLVVAAMPGVILGLLVPSHTAEQVGLLRWMTVALAPLPFVLVLLNYELAQRRFWLMVPFFLLAGGYVLAAWWWHGTLMQIVWALGVASTAALVVAALWVGVFCGRPRKK